MYVIVNSITAPPPILEVMAETFREAVVDLIGLDGFLGFEIWREESSLLAISRWTNQEASLVNPRSGVFERHLRSISDSGAIVTTRVRTYEAEVIV
jgi:heme-degrading monooxygenase HmoA